MLLIKLDKEDSQKILETLYRLKYYKKEERLDEWLEYYSRFHFIEDYRKRLELELVLKNLLKIFVYES